MYIYTWIPFGDNLLKLERYREDWPLRKDDTHKSRVQTTCTFIYIYIERERDREREIYIYMYTYTNSTLRQKEEILF